MLILPIIFIFSTASALSIPIIGGSSNEYAPATASCPSGSLLRTADGLSSDEASYVSARHEITNQNLIDFLENKANLDDFDASSFVAEAAQTKSVTIGLAFSGGSYRAMLVGAGEMLGLDLRSDNVLGGLLQSSTYMSGLSGAAWLVSSVVFNDFLSIGDIVSGELSLWDLSNPVYNLGGLNVVSTASIYAQITTDVLAKKAAGFDVTASDFWGRALSYQLLSGDDGGVSWIWSDIKSLNSFQTHQMPFPFVVADEQSQKTSVVNVNSTIVEFNPFEMGSWDSTLNTFTNIAYLGTEATNGIPDSSTCYNAFDNAGFILGTSSSLFNSIVNEAGVVIPSAVTSALESIVSSVTGSDLDVASYDPNPFIGGGSVLSQEIKTEDQMDLVDGGEDGQNIPFAPLIQKEREVDIIFSFDNSADQNNLPDGSGIIATYQRQYAPIGKGTPFPYVPEDTSVFLSSQYKGKPMFFGCDATQLSGLVTYHELENYNATSIPLVVYVPNAVYSYNSATSTYKLSYSESERNSMIQNGVDIVTMSSLEADSEWAACVGCAVIRRSQERMGQQQSDQCAQCFQKYCWYQS